MRLQIIQDGQGNDAGVFISMKDWNIIKSNYPDIDNVDNELTEWQQKELDIRLKAINENPGTLLSIDSLLDELNNEV